MVSAEVAALDLPTGNGKVEVRAFDTLLYAFAQSMGAGMILRGLRAVSDFEYEFQMAGMNARLNPAIETVFLMASDRHQFISSRFVKEIGQAGRRYHQLRILRVAERLAAICRAKCSESSSLEAPSHRNRLSVRIARQNAQPHARPAKGCVAQR